MTTSVVGRDGSASRTTAVAAAAVLAVGLLACKKLINREPTPESICKRMQGWDDAPKKGDCKTELAKMKTESPEVYACFSGCVPKAESFAEAQPCMKPCMLAGMKSGSIGPTAKKANKRATTTLKIDTPKGSSVAGKCWVSLKLEGYEDRSENDWCSYDIKKDLMGLVVKVNGGKSLKVAGKSFAFDGDEALVELPLVQRWADVTTDKPSVKLPMELVDDDGKWTGELSVSADVMEKWAMGITRGPLLFDGESAGSGGKSTILVVGSTYTAHGGPAVPLSKVDLIGVVSSKSRSYSSCRYKNGLGRTKSVKRRSYDKVATVYERRTGKRLGSKRFKAATPSCPSSVKATEYVISKHADSKRAENWAKDFVD